MHIAEIDNQVITPELDVVRVVSLRGDNSLEVLLVKEVDDKNWKLPGGKIHAGETIFEAFLREIEEELGFIPQKKTIQNYQIANIPGSENLRHIILVDSVPLEMVVKTDEVEQASYFAIDDLPNTKFKEHIRSAVEIISD